MSDSLLTPRDRKALLLLVNAKIKSAMAGEQALWRGVAGRLTDELRSQPESLSPKLCALLSAARAGNLDELDRVAKQLASGLMNHGDVEGANAFRSVAESEYQRPKRPPSHAGPRPPTEMRLLPKKSASGAVEWFAPEDLTGVMVLDAATGPELERLVGELKLAELFVDADIDAPTRILFSGPPGTGKTLGARWLGGQLNMPVAVARLDGVVSKYIGETAQNMRDVLKDAVAEEGTIVFLDEIDGIFVRRDSAGTSSAAEENKRCTSAVLQQLDLLPPQQIIIAATNFPERLDPALRRRLSTEILFNAPDEAARRKMIAGWWKKIPATTAATEVLVDKSAGRSGAFLRTVAMKSARLAIVRGNDEAADPQISESDATRAVEQHLLALDGE